MRQGDSNKPRLGYTYIYIQAHILASLLSTKTYITKKNIKYLHNVVNGLVLTKYNEPTLSSLELRKNSDSLYFFAWQNDVLY